MTTTPAQRAIVTREQLASIEWGGTGMGNVLCPACNALPDEGHASDCWLALALAAPAPAGDGREAFELLAADVCVLLQLEPAEAVRRIASLVSDEALAWRREQPTAAPWDGPADLVALVLEFNAAERAAHAASWDNASSDRVSAARYALRNWTPAAPSAPTAMPPTMPSVEVGDWVLDDGDSQPCVVRTDNVAWWNDVLAANLPIEVRRTPLWRREQP